MNFFPVVYQDELLYSVLARYCIRSGNIREIHNFVDLFRTRSCVAVMELATNLDALIKNMPANTKYTVEYFIYRHTLFPYLAAFIDADRAEKIIQHMRRGKGAIPYISIGIVSSSISLNQYFRFCPKCFKEDMEKYGEPYWHRLHQITGVFICPKHKVPINDSIELVRGGNRQRYVNASTENCVAVEEIKYSDCIMEKMLWMAEDVEILLNNRFLHREQQWFRDQFRAKLIEKGYARMNNFIFQKELKQDIQSFYSVEYLQLVQSPITKNSGWLETIIRKNDRITNPLRYLLLARFLGIPLKEFFYCPPKLPIEINNNSSNCVEVYQQLWDQRLIELCHTELSIREISSILGSTPKTVKKHIDKLEIEPFWKYNGGGQFIHKKYKETEEFKRRKEEARAKWLRLHEETQDRSSNKIRKDHEGLYTWFLKYDREWLHKNSRISTFTAPKTVDWDKRDAELLPKVKQVVKGLYDGRPQRITWSTVGSRLGIGGWLAKRKEKLPLVKAYMDSVVESLEKFQIRKIGWALDELEREEKQLTFWNLVEMAGVKPKYMKSIEKDIKKMILDKGYSCDFL